MVYIHALNRGGKAVLSPADKFDNKDAFVAFDFKSFIKSISLRSDLSGEISRKYLTEIEKYTGKFPSQDFEQTIGVIFEAFYNEKNKSKASTDDIVFPLIDHAEGKVVIREAAHKLSKIPEIQSSYFLNQALLAVLDTELFPLNRELTNSDNLNLLLLQGGYRGFITGLFFGLMPNGFKWIFSILKYLYFIVLAGIMIISFSSNNNWVGFLIGAYLIHSVYKSWKKRKFINRLVTCYSGLKQIRDEIKTTTYNSKHISEKLKEQEKYGAYVPSIAYSLLECIDKIPIK